MMMNVEQGQFEAGENVTDQVRRSKVSGIVVSVRLAPEDSIKLIDLAEESGKTVSQIARQAIRVFIAHSGQRPPFVPEITGGTPNIKIIAFAPLGPRTVKDVGIELKNLPPSPRTGELAGAV